LRRQVNPSSTAKPIVPRQRTRQRELVGGHQPDTCPGRQGRVADLSAEEGPGPGGYDAAYRQCPCFWGTEPGRMVQLLARSTVLAGAHVLDLGCGEGKNAVFLASLGCIVEAWDISAAALSNAKAAWPDAS